MSDPMFQQFNQQADQMYHKFKDFVAGGPPNTFTSLEHEIREIVEDFEKNKHPRSIEARIKTVMTMLKQAEHMPHGEINYNEFDFLHDNYEHMIMALRKLPNY